jgi:hypothetical protein
MGERRKHFLEADFAVNQSRRSTGAVKTLSTNRFARGLARNTTASGMKASGTRKYAMTPYPRILSCRHATDSKQDDTGTY